MFSANLKRIAACVAAAAILVLCAPALHAADRGPSTPEERQKAVAEVADYLENPLGPKAPAELDWVLQWVVQVPDVHIAVCPMLDDQPKGNDKDAKSIFAAMLMAETGFAVQHPEALRDSQEAYQAGIDGVLHVYEKLLAVRPADRQAFLDDLLQRRAAGTLSQWVAEHSARCKS